MKRSLLILSIYHPTPDYDKLLEQNNAYINKCKTTKWFNDNVKYFFITFRPDLHDEYSIDENRNLMTIRGTETLIPGILHKTLKALEIVTQHLKWSFDFVLRTTVATNVNVRFLLTHIQTIDTTQNIYLGNIVKLQHYDPPMGIVSQKYWGTFYAGGNFAIFNYRLVELMLQFRSEFDYSVVDDLALGIFITNIHQLLEPVNFISLNRFVSPSGEWNANRMVIFNNSHKHNRSIDINNHLLNNNTLINTVKNV